MRYSKFVLVCTLLIAIFVFEVDSKFKSYWNIYHRKCNKMSVDFDLDQFGIIHNTGNEWHADWSNIIYRPGLFPEVKNSVVINGGMPELGDLQAHIDQFQRDLDNELVDVYQGLLCLDFEAYKPSFRTNSRSQKDASLDLVRQEHPDWSSSQISQEATKRFNNSSRNFFEVLLDMMREQRPNVLFGYYGFPYCNNYNPPNTECAPGIIEMNDNLKDWMYKKSTALMPSLYTKEIGDGKRMDIATHRTYHLSTEMKESLRVNAYNLPILPYINYVFKDTRNIIPDDILTSILWIIKYYKGDGAIIWNTSAAMYTLQQCTDFKEYLYSTLGPLLKCMDELPESAVEVLRGRYPIFEGENDGYVADPTGEGEQLVDMLVQEAGILEEDPNDTKAVKIITRFCETLQ